MPTYMLSSSLDLSSNIPLSKIPITFDLTISKIISITSTLLSYLAHTYLHIGSLSLHLYRTSSQNPYDISLSSKMETSLRSFQSYTNDLHHHGHEIRANLLIIQLRYILKTIHRLTHPIDMIEE